MKTIYELNEKDITAAKNTDWTTYDINEICELFYPFTETKNVILLQYINYISAISAATKSTDKPHKNDNNIDFIQWGNYYKEKILPSFINEFPQSDAWSGTEWRWSYSGLQIKAKNHTPYLEIQSRDCVDDKITIRLLCYDVNDFSPIEKAIQIATESGIFDCRHIVHRSDKPKQIGKFSREQVKTDDDFIRKFKELKKEKVLVLNTNNPSAPADMKILSSKIDQENSQSFYERVVKAMYDIASVPLSSGNVTSGGDTGQARILGNGWESAQNQAQVDQTYLVQFERDLLKNMLWICKNTANCPVDKVSASDIAIKFNINMSNNLYVKSEALKMLNDIYLPEKAALNIVGITKDVDGLGEAWKQNKEKIRLQEIEKEKELANISSASTQTNEQVNE